MRYVNYSHRRPAAEVTTARRYNMRLQERVFEYRINKKGCECFRTRSRSELIKKNAELVAQHPNTAYTIQTRYVNVNRYGVPELLPNGEPQWSTWS